MDKNANIEWFYDYLVQFLKSPGWSIPILQFIDDNCSHFDDSEENKLIYTTLFEKFQSTIDNLLEVLLKELNISAELFLHIVEQGMKNVEDKVVFEQIVACNNFMSFKKLMTRRNKEIEVEVVRNMKNEGFATEQELETALEKQEIAEVGYALALSIAWEEEQRRKAKEAEDELHRAILESEQEYKAKLAQEKIEEEKRKKIRDEEDRIALEKLRKQEEERLRMLKEKEQRDSETRKRLEEEKRRQDEEECRKKEEARRREEEARRREEEARRRDEEARRQGELSKKLRDEADQRRREQEQRDREEAERRKREQEERDREEADRRKREKEQRDREEAERQRREREEQERIQAENQRLQLLKEEEERRRQRELQLKMDELKRQRELELEAMKKKAEEDAERLRLEIEAMNAAKEAERASKPRMSLIPMQGMNLDIDVLDINKGRVDLTKELQEAENLRRLTQGIIRRNEGNRRESVADREEKMQKQRELLLAKKKMEREQQIKEYKESGGLDISHDNPDSARDSGAFRKRSSVLDSKRLSVKPFGVN